jgi:hypothetical protein
VYACWGTIRRVGLGVGDHDDGTTKAVKTHGHGRYIVLTAIALAVVLLSASFLSSALSGVQAGEPSNGCLQLRDHRAYRDGDWTTITGRVRNDCGWPLQYAEIRFRLYNTEGNVIGNPWANVASLNTGETWEFKATTYVTSPGRYELDSLGGK